MAIAASGDGGGPVVNVKLGLKEEEDTVGWQTARLLQGELDQGRTEEGLEEEEESGEVKDALM